MVAVEEFTYDANGNRLTANPGGTDVYSYVPGTNLLDNVVGSVTKFFAYDSSGNLTSDQSKSATLNYDHFNRLDTVSFSGQNYLALGYGPAGDRIFKDYHWSVTVPCEGQDSEYTYIEPLDLEDDFQLVFASYEYNQGVESFFHLTSGGPPGPPLPPPLLCTAYHNSLTVYLRGAGGLVLAEYDDFAGNSLKYRFIYAGSKRIAMVEPDGDILYYLADHLGSTRAVVDESGALVDQYKKYHAFGESVDDVVSSENDYKYTGKPFDTDGGFDCYYYGGRYYEPTLGRFLAIDPRAVDAPDWGPYIYTQDNPLKYVDPDGEFLVAAAVIAIIAVLATYEPGNTPTSPEEGESAQPSRTEAEAALEIAAIVTGLSVAASGIEKALENDDTKPTDGGDKDIPQDAKDVAERARTTGGGSTTDGRKGGGKYDNSDGKLPEGNYVEYDVDHKGDSGRSDRRVVYDKNTGKSYYTDDHYE
ncbi:MAG: RHS repeat-associated core domain-containing protein, partial [Candidatus Zixiibacteriota bacterium]